MGLISKASFTRWWWGKNTD